jgi:hypothetical protein
MNAATRLMVGVCVSSLVMSVLPAHGATPAKKTPSTKTGTTSAKKTPPTTKKGVPTTAAALTDGQGKAVSAVLRVAVSDVFRAAKAGSFALAKDGLGLAVGDRVKTNNSGRGTLNFSDGSLLRVAGTAEITVSDVNVSTKGRKVNVNLTSGDVYAKVAKTTGSTNEWTVTTPTATASVRGTAFSVSCDALDCTFAVIEGLVRVQNPQGFVDLTPGVQTIVVAGQAPPPPTPISTSADQSGGNWLRCNGERDAVVVTPISGLQSSGCGETVGPVVLPLIVPGAPTPSTPTTRPSASSTPSTSAPPTTGVAPSGPTTLAALPTRPSSYTGTGGLTATLIENPFKCTGAPTRPYVNYSGLVPGETMNWVWGLAGGPPTQSGSSTAGGTTGFSIWQCPPSWRGQVWTFTLTTGTGNSVTYDLVLSD